MKVSEEALDKACMLLADRMDCPNDAVDDNFEVEHGCEAMCSERTSKTHLCWKEYLEKDRKEDHEDRD